MYAERCMVSELDPLQAVCNNTCTALKWVCYCINENNNTTIIHHSIQKQRTTAKELSMDSFKCRCKRTSLFSQLLFVYIKNKPQWQWMLLVPIPYIAARNARELQAGYLLANGTRSMHFPIHFYTNRCVPISFMTFYDVKPQLAKSCCRG